MEPFGILQFLQTLLSDAQKKSPATPPTEQTGLRENAPKSPAQKEDFDELTTTEIASATENAPATEAPPRTQDAILRYMENHDKRAKKFKH